MWFKMGGADLGNTLFKVTGAEGAVLDMRYQAVISASPNDYPIVVTTTNAGNTGDVYRTYLQGPMSTDWAPSAFNAII